LLEAKGIPVDYLRLRAAPFHTDVRKYIETHEKIYVVEMNRDGQMCQLLQIEYPDLAARIFSVAHSDGLPLSARWITGQILHLEVKS